MMLHGLDTATPLRAPGGLLRLQGWIVDRRGQACAVRLRIGDACFDCITGGSRPDVAATHPGLPGAGDSGFALEAVVPPGLHVATLECRREGTHEWSALRTLSLIAETGAARYHLESPPPANGASEWHVQGWCFHPQHEIERLSLLWNGRETELAHGAPRPDIAETFPGMPAAAGFAGRVPLSPGTGPVSLVARLRHGGLQQLPVPVSLTVPDPVLDRAVRTHQEVRASLIRFQPVETPDVSIIIPIYNQLDLTLGCLEALARHADTATFEVIVIDDCSSPEVPATLGSIPHVRVHTNEKNQGFVLNCNRGAELARGQYVLFLNNDTEPQAGWLEALLAVFAERPRAGAVGAKLIYPDGRLQEAGGLIWSDASGWNYGKGDDPSRPEYNYLRQVDYCSGACLLVPRALFREVGGFDTRYQPAYYEDADLAFTLRARGREVYYQPASVIVHFEGVSSGTDTRTGVKRHQVINREKFLAKWETVLRDHGADPFLIGVARDRFAAPRVLVVDACALTPDADSGSLRMYNLLLILAQRGAKVTFAAENLQWHEPYSTQLRLAGVEHLGVPHVTDLAAYIRSHGFAFDFIILSRKGIAEKFLPIARAAAPAACLVFDTVDLMYLRLERQAEHEQSPALRAAADESKAVELELCRQADRVLVVSTVEATLLGAHLPAEKISLVSNIHRTFPSETGFAARRGLLFVGGYQHPPNVDAVMFLLDEIMPRLRTRLPGLEIHLVGSNMPASIAARASESVRIHGYVPDIEPLFQQVLLSVAPLRYGAGVKGKVNQSMAHGVPVVATSIATEGMNLTDGEDVLVADTAEAFAEAIVRLHEDAACWQRLAAGGRRNIDAHFSFHAVERELVETLDLGPAAPTPAAHPLPRRVPSRVDLDTPIAFGEAGNAAPYVREGWGAPEASARWIVGHHAQLDFQLPPGAQPVAITARLYPFLLGNVRRQTVRLCINHHEPAASVVLEGPAEAKEVTWPIAADCLRPDGLLSLAWHCPDAVAPVALGLSHDERKLSVAFLELTISRAR